MVFIPHRKHIYRLPRLVTGTILPCLYVDDDRTSLETHVFTACNGDRFTLLYVDDALTSQETYTWTVREIAIHYSLT
jgi:hypothetical protein